MFIEFITLLQDEIRKGLPGWDAQRSMSSRGSDIIGESVIIEKNPRLSSVLLWLFPLDDAIYTRLIVRSEIGKVHAGQIALPGGRYEESDIDLWFTALREAAEEIGLPAHEVQFLGKITPLYVPPSNYIVHPFIGYSNSSFPSVNDPAEVKENIDTDIRFLIEPESKDLKKIVRIITNESILTPCYIIQRHVIWGATAMILSEFEELMRRTKYFSKPL
jgi:8-oxo-dGTP pyrophosphatase MutT (NUDIX family)